MNLAEQRYVYGKIDLSEIDSITKQIGVKTDEMFKNIKGEGNYLVLLLTLQNEGFGSKSD